MTRALTDEVAPGVHRIAVPTPFAVGRINCYLLTGDPLTLVDTGLNSGTSLDYLERALTELGVRIEDLERIVLTHQHMDHEGLLEIVARRSAADVAAFARAGAVGGGLPKGGAKGDDAYAQSVMTRQRRTGRHQRAAGRASNGLRAYGSRGTITVPAARRRHASPWAGASSACTTRPGSQPSDLVFHQRADRAADRRRPPARPHLVQRARDQATRRQHRRPAPDAADRLQPDRSRATRETGASKVLPGHGEVIDDHVTLIDARLNDQGRRARKILKLIAESR